MSMLDRVKKLNEERANQVLGLEPKPAPPALPVPPAIKKDKKPRPPAKGSAGEVRYVCGHTRPVAAFASKRCEKCVGDANAARNAELKAKGGEKKKKKKWRHGKLIARLPAGSSFKVFWDGKEWRGFLSIPKEGFGDGRIKALAEEAENAASMPELEESRFFNDAGAVFSLLPKLDSMFRETLPKEESGEQVQERYVD